VDSAHSAHGFAATVRGHSLTVVGQPGVWSWDRLNPGTAALLEAAEIAVTDHVLDLGSGTGVVGAAAAHAAERGRVTLVDCSVAAVACSRLTLSANRIENAEVQLSDGCSGLLPASFDLVLCHLPRERAVQEELLGGAAAVLRPGGALYVVAHRQAGIRTALATARRLLGHCGVVRQRKGYHVAMAVRPPQVEVAIPNLAYHSHLVLVDGVETVVAGKPGVFAWDRLDEGTAALIATMRIASAEQVLDLGCGTGLAGVVAARRAVQGHVTLLDVDLRAAEAARRTIAANGIDNAEVVLSDLGTELPARTFDVVVTNPPFHQDMQTDPTAAGRFVAAAQRLLRPSGRLYLVANRFLPYGPWLQAAFDQVAVVLTNPRFSVWEATLPRL
jgi:16S rRNA G1207 methylase RsmC